MKTIGSPLTHKIHLDVIWVDHEFQFPMFWEYDPEEVVLDANTTYILNITYPVKFPYQATINVGKRGMSRKELVMEICSHYRRMYKLDKRSGGKKYGVFDELNNIAIRGIYLNDRNDIILQGV